MNLSKKNFLYSLFISVLLVALVTGYFVLMLPSLYEAHMNDINYDSVVKLHQSYMENGSYEGVEVRNPTGCISVKIPTQGDVIEIKGLHYHVTLTILDQKLLNLMNKVGNISSLSEEEIENLWSEFEEEDFIDELLKQENTVTDSPVKVDFETDAQDWIGSMSSDVKVHRINDNLYVWESLASDEFNQYICYFAVEMSTDGITVTTLPVMAPKINEITPVVLGSLPMIIVVVFLLVLLFSQLYSRKIVNPIIKISHYAETAMQAPEFEVEKLTVDSKDEIGALADSINEMYTQLADNYNELKNKNKILADENKRQEVFLRASSHQLKTPIAAALLLTEGMLGEVGKYKDTKEYLPQVKQQLLSMKKIVDDILYLNASVSELHVRKMNAMALITDIAQRYQIQINNKQLQLIIEQGELMIYSDDEILSKILDNLISNAISYTQQGGKITIMMSGTHLNIKNFGSHIENELLQHIYEPFVSGNTGQCGHGLGLYVAAYYAGLLGHEITIDNEEDGVRAEVVFGGNANVNDKEM